MQQPRCPAIHICSVMHWYKSCYAASNAKYCLYSIQASHLQFNTSQYVNSLISSSFIDLACTSRANKNLPVKSQRVQKCRETLHYQQYNNCQNRERGEDEKCKHAGNDGQTQRKREWHPHHHTPQHFWQLCTQRRHFTTCSLYIIP